MIQSLFLPNDCNDGSERDCSQQPGVDLFLLFGWFGLIGKEEQEGNLHTQESWAETKAGDERAR